MKKSNVELLEQLLQTESSLLCFGEYSKVYPYTTENIAGYLPEVKNKSILSVVGSGDHYLNLITAGARCVDSFDINYFAILFLKLKKAAIRALPLDELYYFLTFDCETFYPKVQVYLDDESKEFWDYYVDKYINYSGFFDSLLFYPRVMEGDYSRRNIYMADDEYRRLKKQISLPRDEDTYHDNIYDLVNILEKKYDHIYLSNINTYQSDQKEFRYLLRKLFDNNLKDGGRLFCGYYYLGQGNGLDYIYSSFADSEIIEVPSISYSGRKKDKVLVLNK